MSHIDVMKQALEYLQDNQHLIADNERHAYVMEYNAFVERLEQTIAGAEKQQALDKMAENARELGLSYEQPAHEPEFITHNVDTPYDWSEWVCPDPKGYLMKCCDCGLVHEAEFKVVRYQSETEREDCEMVDDPNLQAVFRMRRSEQWSPVDTAHRAGGLPMEPDPDELTIAYMSGLHEGKMIGAKEGRNKLATWMMQCGFATGHGDTIEDLLCELDTEVEARLAAERERFALECIDLVAFYGGPVDLEAAIREKGGAV